MDEELPPAPITARKPEPPLANDESGRCFICNSDISMLDLDSKQEHLNYCIDVSASDAKPKPRHSNVPRVPSYSQVDLTDDEVDFAETKVDALKLLMQTAQEQAREDRKHKSLEERDEGKLAIAMVKSVTGSRRKKSADLLSTSILPASEAQVIAMNRVGNVLYPDDEETLTAAVLNDKTNSVTGNVPLSFKSELHSKKASTSLWKLTSTEKTGEVYFKLDSIMRSLYEQTKVSFDNSISRIRFNHNV